MKRQFAIFFALTLLLSGVPHLSYADDTTNGLQAELDQIEKQIAADQQQVTKTASEARSLAATLKKLTQEKAVLDLQIASTDFRIHDTGKRLTDTASQIKENESERVAIVKEMSDLISLMAQSENQSPLYTLLQSNNLSEAMDNEEQYLQLAAGLHTAVIRVRTLADTLDGQKQTLEKAQSDAVNLQSIQALQQAALVDNASNQQSLLAQTKGQEKTFQAQLGDHKAEAAAIRTRIYQLLDTGSTQLTFGEAVKTASGVSSVTGVDTAFLLSVLSQESNLGANVGTCNRPGDPPSKNWKAVMKPSRDQEPFVQITGDLGRPTDGTPVSCPMHDKNGNQIGWGGAMGPAQFIPSTWLGWESKISALTGAPADPWSIRDAFIAAALKLKADGANGTEQGEWSAAMRYFSGSTDTRFRFYGDQVVARAKQYAQDIKELNS